MELDLLINGDVVYSHWQGMDWVSIFYKKGSHAYKTHCFYCIDNGAFATCIEDLDSYPFIYSDEVELATEENKKLLFDKIAKEGYIWDCENKKLYKPKPNKFTYRRLTFCDPQEVCNSLAKYDEMGYDILSLQPVVDGKEYLLYLKRTDD